MSKASNHGTPYILDCTPPTRQQICACCHWARGCKECCNKCKDECATKYDCQIPLEHDSVWWNNILRAVGIDGMLQHQPDNIKEYLIKNYK